MSYSFTIPAANGTYTQKSQDSSLSYHQLAIKTNGTPTAGSVTVNAKSPGSSVFEPVPSGTIDLTAPVVLNFTSSVLEYQVVVTGITGAAIQIHLTDNIARAGGN